MGAGAVGCYYGGMLARAGSEVVLIGRPAHVDAIRNNGLDFETAVFREHIALAADTEAAAVAGADLVLCCVKSTDTAAAAEAMAPHLAPNAFVLSLQNGVDNGLRLRERLGDRVASAVVYVASAMAGPGHLRHHGRGELVVEPSAAAKGIDTLFVRAGVPVEVSDNVAGALWAKLILNCAYNALSAITQIPYGPLVQGEGIDETLREIVRECAAVAAAEGIALPADPWPAIERIAQTMPTQTSSTAQDLARGKKSEIDYINGHIVRRGEAHGIATPVNRTLHALVKLIEGRRWRFDA